MNKIVFDFGTFRYDRWPDHCPRCHCGILPKEIGKNYVNREGIEIPDAVQIVYRCPRIECQEAFVATYRKVAHKDYYELRNTQPFKSVEPDTAPEIKTLSPSYHKIVSQSASAEGRGLDQIAGCGYRKALEYLIKDYAIANILTMLKLYREHH